MASPLLVPHYRLVKPLGKGGFGQVWEAEAPGGLHVALKFIRTDLAGRWVEGRPQLRRVGWRACVCSLKSPPIEVGFELMTVMAAVVVQSIWKNGTT